jgi:hypothetical protein
MPGYSTGLAHSTVLQGNRVAVKLLTRGAGSAASQGVAHAMLRQEALIMCQLYHPCIAHIYGIVDDSERQVSGCCMSGGRNHLLGRYRQYHVPDCSATCSMWFL